MKMKHVTRRTFVKAALATGALSAIAGCGRSGDETVYIPQDFDEDYVNPKNLSEKYDRIMPATSPHNCGGGCNMMAFVKDDVIVGIGADENVPDFPVIDRKTNDFTFKDGDFERADFPRSISCLRCRAHRSLMYDANRLLYPMIQRGERGNINTFERVSWDEALSYMFDKVKTIRKNYGPGAFMKTHTTGAGGFTTTNFENLAGPFASYRVNWSFFAINQTMPFVCGGPTGTYSPSNISNIFTSDVVIAWAHNFAESLFGNDQMWRVSQMKEKGIDVRVVDTHINTTANTLFNSTDMKDKVYIIPGGTDTALVCGMVHTMLTDYSNELMALWGAADWTELCDNIGKLMYGFFDKNATPKKIADGNPALQTAFNDHYLVPDGGSWSAYIFGNSDYLVTKGVNNGTSIYPNHIRYNVWEHSDKRCHPAADTKTWCYGQIVKDAAWASKITGISEARIKELALTFLTKNVSMLCGYAYHRNTEGETETWALQMLVALTKCFGGLNDNHLPTPLKGQKKCRTAGIGALPSKYGAPATGATGWNSNSGTYGANGGGDALVPEKYVYNASSNPAGYLNRNATTGAITIRDAYMYDPGQLSLGASFTATGTISGNQPSTGANGVACFAMMDAVRNTNKPKVTDPLTGGQVYPSDRNDGQIKHRHVPLKGLFNTAGGHPINQYGDVFKNIETMLQKDTPGSEGYDNNCHPLKYSLQLFAVADPMLTSSALWADVLLPTAMSFEREELHSGGFGDCPSLRLTVKVHEPMGDALDERYINGKFAALFGRESEYYGGFVDISTPFPYTDPATGEKLDEKSTRNKYENSTSLMRMMNYQQFRERGVVNAKMIKDAGGSLGSAAAGAHDVISFLDEITSANGVSSRSTGTGKYEAYCPSIVDDYRARYNNNVDALSDNTTSLVNNGRTNRFITIKSNPNPTEGKGMYVYPVPMYVPLPEGIHGDGTAFRTIAAGNTDGIAHPDPLGIAAESYTKYVCTYHPIKRCHSTHSNNPLVTDFYKKDKDGKDAYISYDRALRENTLDGPWKEGVYEPVFTNENTTYTGSNEKVKNGDLVILESTTGAVKVVAQIDNGVRPDTIMLPQGAWNMVISSDETKHGKVDVGGNINSLTSHRSTRIGGGPAVNNDTRVKLIKANK